MQQRAVKLPGIAGIDVSHFQGDIDWKAVKAAGIRFAYLKASEGVSIQDQKFQQNRAGCKANNIPCGAYHFFRAKDSVAPQVDLFVSTLGRLQAGELPPVLDVEVPSDWTQLSVSDRVSIVNEWMNSVDKKLGTTVTLYINPSMFRDVLGSPKSLSSRPLWIAQYPRTPTSQPALPKGLSTWRFWQYSMSGHVSGIDSAVDLNRFNGDAKALSALLAVG